MITRYITKAVALAFGALVYTLGLDVFLTPNHVIDGGVVGISLMAAALTNISFSTFIVILNLPFLYLGYKKIGARFTVASLYSILWLAIWSRVVDYMHLEAVTKDPFLSTVFGGIIIGVGVGLIIRFGGALDGTEMLAIIGGRRLPFSVGEIIMFFNFFILGISGFVFSWNSAMYSLIAYFIAYKAIDVVSNGLDEMKGVLIVTQKDEEVSRVITRELHRGVTLLHGEGAYARHRMWILYCVVSRLEVMQLRDTVTEVDPNAFLSIFDIQEAHGGLFSKKGSSH